MQVQTKMASLFKRGPTMIFLAAGCLALAAAAGSHAIVSATSRTDSDVALNLDPANSAANNARNEQLLLKGSEEPAVLKTVAANARASLRETGLNAAALRQLAFAQDVSTNSSRTAQLINLSTEASRRDFGARLWMIESNVRKEDVVGALREYDIAMRAIGESRAILFPLLTAALEDPTIRSGFAPYVKKTSPWVPDFLRTAIWQAKDPSAVASLLMAAGRSGSDEGVRSELNGQMLAALAAKKQWAMMRTFYLSQRSANPTLLSSPSLSAQSFAESNRALGWQLTASAGVGAIPTKTGLDVEMTSGETALVARKILFLPPGNFVLSVTYGSSEFQSSGLLVWRLQCLPDGSETPGWQGINEKPSEGSVSRQMLTIPARCSAQALDLLVNGGDGQRQSHVTITNISLSAAPR